MAHYISALAVRGAYDVDAAHRLGLRPVQLEQEVVLFSLDDERLVHQLGLSEGAAEYLFSDGERPFPNRAVVHHLARVLVGDAVYAVLDTEYFGGLGDQAAAVYRCGEELMPPTLAARGPISQALKLLGVERGNHYDEFDAVGLAHHRDLDPED